MNIVDIILSIPLIYGLYIGYQKGLIRQIIGITGLFIAFLLSKQYGEIFTQIIIQTKLLKPNIAPFVSHILFFSLILITLNLIGKILRRVLRRIGLGSFESLLGSIIGFLKNFIIISIVLFVLIQLNKTYSFGDFTLLYKSKIFLFIKQLSFPILQSLI